MSIDKIVRIIGGDPYGYACELVARLPRRSFIFTFFFQNIYAMQYMGNGQK